MGTNINWYPGHMKKAVDMMRENVKLVDVVVEIIDARIPKSSRNPVVAELSKGRERIIILNKVDLADESATLMWQKKLQDSGVQVVSMNSVTGSGKQELIDMVQKLGKDRTGWKKEGPIRLMVVGIPNVGKSSLINRLSGRRGAQVGNRPGVTRGKQWIRISKQVQLLDTPGILWQKLDQDGESLNLALCGSIRSEIMDSQYLALKLIEFLWEQYREMVLARYKIRQDEMDGMDCEDREQDFDLGHDILEIIGRHRGFLISGGRIDFERTYDMILDEFRNGKIGRITLEKA